MVHVQYEMLLSELIVGGDAKTKTASLERGPVSSFVVEAIASFNVLLTSAEEV